MTFSAIPGKWQKVKTTLTITLCVPITLSPQLYRATHRAKVAVCQEMMTITPNFQPKYLLQPPISSHIHVDLTIKAISGGMEAKLLYW